MDRGTEAEIRRGNLAPAARQMPRSEVVFQLAQYLGISEDEARDRLGWDE